MSVSARTPAGFGRAETMHTTATTTATTTGPGTCLAVYKPRDEADADTLRPFVPTAELIKLERLSKSTNAAYAAANMAYQQAKKDEKDALDAIRAARAKIKTAKAAKKKYFDTPHWAELDAAYDRAWTAAAAARDAAVKNGESLRTETKPECTRRMMGEQGIAA